MSYTPTTDFLALLRDTPGGIRTERMPGLDWFVVALARAGVITLSVSQTAPIVDQLTTAWFKPAIPSWTFEGSLFLWNALTAVYEPATPDLWASLFAATAGVPVVQDVVAVGPVLVQVDASVVRVQNVGAPVALVMPLSSAMLGDVLISDWANLAGTNPITITRSGADVFPNGATTLTIFGDGGSYFLRRVPGGFAL